jgi:predicted nuclease of restriction endonuclease-like (RecB) superfamily
LSLYVSIQWRYRLLPENAHLVSSVLFGAFLQEMGDMFAFIGSQYKIQVGERDFFIDLLLNHRQLRALVALELKIGELKPE